MPATERGNLADFFCGPVGVGLAGGRGEVGLTGGPDGLVEGGLHHAGGEGVDADIVRGEILGGALHEVDEAGLRGAVGRIRLRTHLTGDGCEDQVGAGAARDQARGEGVGDVDGTDEIDVEHARPVGRGEIPKRKAKFTGADTDGEDHVADGREGRGKGLELFERRDVAEGRLESSGRARKGAIETADVAALGQKTLGDSAANAVGRADDGDVLPGEVEVHGENRSVVRRLDCFGDLLNVRRFNQGQYAFEVAGLREEVEGLGGGQRVAGGEERFQVAHLCRGVAADVDDGAGGVGEEL